MTRRKRTTNRSRGFTLIELLVIIAIIGIMVTVGVVSLTAGRGAVRVKGASRDIYAAIRQARSTALVTQQPAEIVYSTEKVDGEVMAKIEIKPVVKLLGDSIDRATVETYSGEVAKWQHEEQNAREDEERAKKSEKFELVHIRGKESDTGASGDGAKESEGETLADILFAPPPPEVLKGMRLKVEMGDKFDLSGTEEAHKPKISVFSNVDFLTGRKKASEKSTETATTAKNSDAEGDDKEELGEMQEPVSVTWLANGRVEPHMVWVYADGQKPEDGLLLKIDRFGAVKVLSGDGKGDDDR